MYTSINNCDNPKPRNWGIIIATIPIDSDFDGFLRCSRHCSCADFQDHIEMYVGPAQSMERKVAPGGSSLRRCASQAS